MEASSSILAVLLSAGGSMSVSRCGTILSGHQGVLHPAPPLGRKRFFNLDRAISGSAFFSASTQHYLASTPLLAKRKFILRPAGNYHIFSYDYSL